MDIFKVSRLGFGTSQIGGPSLIKGKITGAKPLPKNEAIGILKYAYDNGINFFDTSDRYGNAEELLAEAFSKKRDKVVIATKCGLTNTGKRFFSIPYINTCLENSLRRLKTDYIDIFQLTKPDVKEVTDALLAFFAEKIKQGKIRYFGISIIGNEDGQAYLPKKIIESFQIFYNLLFTESRDLIKNCAKNGKFVIVRSPLNSGILSGRYSMDTKFDEVDSRRTVFCGSLLKERLEYVEKIKKYLSLSSDQVLGFALNFIFSNPKVNVVIPAASKISQLQDYIKIFHKERRFNEKEMKKIIKFLQNEINLQGAGQLK
jgi:aryl-alcohol dehydrogenase-like predicted oxidoreductase